MPAPLASFIRYPGDGNYQGPQVKVIQRRVGADVTFTQVTVPTSQRKNDGIYHFSLGTAGAITATGQDGTTTGFFWLQNPSGSTKVACLRALSFRFTNATAGAIVHATAPRVGIVRATFTGTFSGATATVTKRRTSDATNSADVRTAVTGATVSLEGVCWAALCPGSDITTADVLNLAHAERWAPRNEEDFICIAPGECLVCYQLDAGTASDQRLVSISGTWSEYDNA